MKLNQDVLKWPWCQVEDCFNSIKPERGGDESVIESTLRSHAFFMTLHRSWCIDMHAVAHSVEIRIVLSFVRSTATLTQKETVIYSYDLRRCKISTSSMLNKKIYLGFPQIEEKFSEFGEFRESEKSLKHELGSI